MNSERGSIPLAVVIGAVVCALLLGGIIATCDAAFDDEDEPGDLGAPTLIVARDRNGDDRSDGKNSRGKCEGAERCEDQDFSPSFDNSPIIICIQPGACDFGGDEAAALFPPSPERLVEVITAFGQNVGTAAGALAGAIAGGTAGILL